MAFLLSSLGLPGHAAGNLLGSKGLGQKIDLSQPVISNASSFGSVFSGQVTTLPVPVASTDPLDQLTSAVQNGTPISSIVDRLAGQIADAVQARLPASQLPSGASRVQLLDSIKAALSPPSNAPPGATATQEVAALARRLNGWLSGVARGADQKAGQQSDTSGKILDADKAKDIPAQRDPISTSVTDVPALTRSLLASVVASLPSSSTTAAPPPQWVASSGSDAAKETVSRLSTLARLRTSTPAIAPESAVHIGPMTGLPVTNAAPATIPTPLGLGLASIDPADAVTSSSTAAAVPVVDAAHAQTPSTVPAQVPSEAPSQGPTPSNASHAPAPAPSNDQATPAQTPADLVARMLVRAAGVDARVNDNAPAPQATATVQSASANPASTGRAADTGGTTTPAAQAAANRLTTLLTQAVASAAQSSNGNPAGNDGGTLRDDGDPGSADPTAIKAPAVGAPNPDASTFAVNAATPSAPATASQPSQPATTPQPPQAPVDADAVVEQVVKSMVMRTAADGTSEIRLRLQPENLGSVMLKLTLNGNSVSATAIAQNADVRGALMSNQHQLTRSLAESGLKLTSFSVDLSGGDARDPRNNNDPTSGFGRRFTVHETAAADATPDPTESTNAGPSILPGSMLGLFSYLA